MTRRLLRRVYVVGSIAAVAAASPYWGPVLLGELPGSRVERIGVVGTRFVAPDQVMELAAVPSDASVWDDVSVFERRVSSHPLIERARVRRAGLHALEIAVTEVEPIAFVISPDLVAVDARGRVLPLDPAEARLDLPILGGRTAIASGRVTDPQTLAVLNALARLGSYSPGFISQVSEVRYRAPGAIDVWLMEKTYVARIKLRVDEPVRGLARIEQALAAYAGKAPVREADARFRDQVVLALGEGR